MKLWLATWWLYWVAPLALLCYVGGMALLAPLTVALGDAPFYLLVVVIMIGGWKIKRWAENTIAWHESIKRFR